MKSAYELARERLDRQHGKRAPLSAARKKEIAEIDERTRARIAELEIMLKPRAAEARAAGDFELAGQVEENLRRETEKVRGDGEAEKERARGP